MGDGGAGVRDPRVLALLAFEIDRVVDDDQPNRLLLKAGRKRVRFGKREDQSQERGVGTPENRCYPSRTDQWCWYCCHPFDTQPLPMPVAYDPKLDVFRVTGNFCSFACMKAYNGESTSYLKHANTNNIMLFHKRCTGQLEHISRAPPRVALAVFGGHMSIEQFRAASQRPLTYCVLPPKMILEKQTVHEIERYSVTTSSEGKMVVARRERPPPDLGAAVTFKDVSTKNEPLRLKRPKPLQNNNSLERTMGILLNPPV